MDQPPDFYKELLDNLFDGVYFVDRARVVTYWNKGAERITGYSSAQILGRACRDNLLNHVSSNGTELCLDSCPLAACMEDGVVREADVFLHHIDGHRVPVMVRAAPLRDAQGTIFGAVETFSTDAGLVTIRQELRNLRHSTNVDKLTEIGNRQYLEGRLRAVIAENKGRDSNAALIFMDIDRFKQINDKYGHEIGDKVLHMVAATLKQNIRKTDSVGRWGGEEFLAILDEVDSTESLKEICEKLRILVESSHIVMDNYRLSVTMSIGATPLHPEDSPESLVHRADMLMYQSKQTGRNRVSVG